mmetsp:Transcript_13500/g.29330  ORF Transcript_13500/g.29330 Transcript_13500/m.29330 type:complete len:1434 (+) Transcript_13500:96-4397(+)|eukprot:CAMPEP_0172311828 /NCGR_PEP_ID=MMETSP1058-20130122/15799_1 /TAXON_ID=83371 /ORGANISM="Detonula confervacea, Strain CCMP 353" /LENGTH=1433 /DNA_ID=CAMNT_0013025123 /DNA_START=69 /DNA_END=4370 /DNA_ORIENTATION=-
MAAADLDVSMDFEFDDALSIDSSSDAEFDAENFNPNQKKAAAPATKKSAKSKKTIEETYQKKTQLEHILLRPDTYIGSVESVTQPMWVLNAETQRIQQKEMTFTPGLYKIFDEIVVNAADNKQRDPNMDRMEVTVDAESNTISVLNNGKGIPIVMHKEHNCYVPTLIFGHLLTGSNFDDDEKKTTGGRNGYGAKLANIFSTEFIVECLDSEQGLKFTQVFRDNMNTKEEPKVKKCTKTEQKKGDYTKITFKPDLERFGLTTMDADTIGLLSKRAYDIAGSMGNKGGKKLSVYLNGEKLKVKDFKSYLALFDGITPPAAYEKVDDNWEVGVGVSDGSFQQISFVNCIATTKGGGHVNYIADQVAKKLQAAVKKKNKGGSEIKPNQIKNHLAIFVNCLVENPTFDSQTKENMTVRPSTFSKVKLSDKFVKAVEKCGVVDSIMSYAKFKQNQALKRKGGTKKTKLTGITKLDDANNAGTAKSKDCTLIITEGDSAKSLAVCGLSVVGRDFYGVFPLKGKLLNVRDANHAQIMKNEEIMNLVEIMGLKFNVTYTEENIKTLRYGHLMIMADQDYDGSHIKGLVINFIHHFWPSLLDVPGFLQQFITPIVKCTKGKKSETFFTLPEYEEWVESTGNDAKGWHIKYYKGLGTSTSSEAKDYFSNLDIHEIHFNELSSDYISQDDDEMEEEAPDDDVIKSGTGLIEMAFSKSRVEDRKKWLNRVEKDTFLNYRNAQTSGVNYSDFINRELVLFSQYDNVRSIPHIMDGFKPSQRKVLYACFKKKLKSEIKVAQLAGYIGEHSAYHHGDMSLNGTIVGMAQSYVGSNNVNLLYPSGQFGTRRMGGKDAASSRYIFTRLEKIARAIFHPDDDALLNYLNDDGLSIEPEYYMPVIPMVLVNGSDGIGTGWSCTIQNHSPREVISNIRKMINGDEPEEMHPYFCGYTGEIIAETGKREGSYFAKGKIERIDDTTLLITELPIGKWTQDYKAFLEGLMTGTAKSPNAEISDFRENHTDTTVSFTVTSEKGTIDAFEKAKDGLYGKFKLSTTISTNNMTVFDDQGKIHKYKTSLDILRIFFHHRLDFYGKRKAMLLQKMGKELMILDNKARFVEEVCKGDLVVSNRKRTQLLADLKERGYDLCPKEEKKNPLEEGEAAESVEESASDAELSKGYEYLLGMKIWSLTFERAEELRRQREEKAEEVKKLKATSHEAIWLADLDAIDEALVERDADMAAEFKKELQAQSKSKAHNKKKATTAAKKKAKGKKKTDQWDSDLEDSDNNFVAAKPAPRAKAAPKKPVAKPAAKKPVAKAPKAPPTATATSSAAAVDETVSVLEKLSINEDKNDTKPAAATKKAAPKKAPAKKAPAKKAAPKKAPAKKAEKLYDSSDEESDDFNSDSDSEVEMVSAPVPARARSGRAAAKKITYVIDDSDDESFDEDSDGSDF